MQITTSTFRRRFSCFQKKSVDVAEEMKTLSIYKYHKVEYSLQKVCTYLLHNIDCKILLRIFGKFCFDFQLLLKL